MAGFNLADYEEVKDRIPRFWAQHPDGGLATELLHHDGQTFIVKATLVRSDGRALATGLAEEVVGSSNVNKTSALENCETSAIGRALANAGFSAGKNRPSREEMSKAGARSESGSRPVGSSGAPRLATEKQRKFIERLVDKTGVIPETWPLADDLSVAAAAKLIDWLQDQPVEPLAERAATVRKQLDAEEVS